MEGFMKSQNKAILAHLQSGKTITQAQAVALFDCYRLGARIYDLKQQGHAISTEKVTKKTKQGKVKQFARYSMEAIND